MVLKHTHRNLTWIDLECPTNEEVRTVMSEYNIHPLVAEELVGPSLRPKVEIYADFIYLILHFPVIRRKRRKRFVEQQEIDFIVGKNFVITSRYGEIESLHKFSKLFEVNSILHRSEMGDHAGFLFFSMIRILYDSLSRELDFMSDSIRDIEEHIFKGHERAMVVRISEVSRDLLDFRRATSLHKEILESFEAAAKHFFGDGFNHHTRSIIGEYYRIHNHIESNRESLGELRETNNSLLDARETETMKMITIAAFLTLPASVITNFFQMATKNTPILGQPDDWLIITSVCVISTVFLLILAKIKKWF